MDLQRLVDAIVRKLWLVIVCAVIGGGLFGANSVISASQEYQAQTTLYILNRSTSLLSGSSPNLQDIAASRELAKDYAQILLSRRVLEPAKAELATEGVPVTGIESALQVNVTKDSSVLSIMVTWPDPQQAAQIANAVSRSFVDEISTLTNKNSIGILDEALTPAAPVPVNHLKLVIVGALAGIIVALGIIYIRELFDNTIRSASEIENRLDLKVIGIIPEHTIS